jgi:hypothetical protein
MHVIAGGPQIAVAAALHQLRFVAATEHVPEELVPVIEPDAVRALPPSHPGHQVRFRRLQHQVIVVGHQAIGMHVPAPEAFGANRFSGRPPPAS